MQSIAPRGNFLFGIALFTQVLSLTDLAHADEAKLYLQNENQKVTIESLHWDSTTVPVNPLNEPNGADSTSTPSVTLKGKFLDKTGKTLILVLDNSNPIEIHLGETDEHLFKVDVPIRSEKTQVHMISISDSGISSKDAYVLEVPSYSQLSPKIHSGSQFELKRARISGALFMADSSQSLLTSTISWNPLYQWKPWIRFQGVLGATPIKSLNLSYTIALEYGLGASIQPFKGVWLEGAVGAQYWTDAGTHAPFAGGNLVFQLQSKVLLLVDQIVVGYTEFFAQNHIISEMKIGIGIKF